MARVFITGSSDGLGKLAAQFLIKAGHRVVLHARSETRAQEAKAAVPGAEHVVVGDLSSIAQTRSVADQVNSMGSFDAVIHNAGVGYQEPRRIETEDGLPHVFAVNTAGTLRSDRSHPTPEASRVLELRPTPEWRCQSEGSCVERTALARTAGLLRHQAARCDPCFCGRQAVDERSLERCRSGLGSHQDGRSGSSR